jgi:hypothetical protein
MTTTTSNPFAGTRIATGVPSEPTPTDAQVNYLGRLATDVYGSGAGEYLVALKESPRWTKREISKEIDALRSAPKAGRDEARSTSPRSTSPQAAAVEGFHILDKKVYKVQSNRAGTAFYVKALVLGEHGEKGVFEYVGSGPLRFLSLDFPRTYSRTGTPRSRSPRFPAAATRPLRTRWSTARTRGSTPRIARSREASRASC